MPVAAISKNIVEKPSLVTPIQIHRHPQGQKGQKINLLQQLPSKWEGQVVWREGGFSNKHLLLFVILKVNKIFALK